MWWWIGVALAGDPAVHVAWKGSGAELSVHPPPGEHVAPEAPFDLELAIGDRLLRVGGFGEDLARGLRLGDVRGRRLQGDLSVSLCEDGGSRCRLVSVQVSGAASDRKRGLAVLDVGPPRPAVSTAFPARIDAELALEEALAEAGRQGRPVLLDFGAVWCPPCQLMDVEVFAADPRPAVVDAFVLAKVDVDDPSAWGLLDRYDVGGYPTVVALEADGTEIGRIVGYRGLDDTVAWMDAVATGRYVRHADDPRPHEAAELAWRAVREGRPEDAEALLAVAAGEPESVAFRLARFHVAPTVEDAAWLGARAPGHAIDWVGAAQALIEDEGGRAAVLAAIRRDLPDAPPLLAADLLAYAAELASPDEAPVLWGAAAALVRGRLTGDPIRDKGHFTWLAYLIEQSGQLEDALAVLADARVAFPDEPTFHASHARMLLRHDRAEEALEASSRAVELAWGDNRLTAALTKVDALLALDRRDAARAFVDRLLADEPAPDEALDVRTHRYRERLRERVDE